MRPIRFLVPGTTGKFLCGGLLVELQVIRLLKGIVSAELVTYRQKELGKQFLPDLLRERIPIDNFLWIISWGFDIPLLLRLLDGCFVIYHAHSSGYGFSLPLGVPILAVSHHTLGYWGSKAPHNPMFLLPNAIELKWVRQNIRLRINERANRCSLIQRSIDVLVQKRKGSNYIFQQLVPLLRAQGLTVVIQKGWTEDIVDLISNTKVYLYDSANYWKLRGVTEGFGLPPLEAMACGCIIFSSLNSGLANIVDPGHSGHQVGYGNPFIDTSRIMEAVTKPQHWQPDSQITAKILLNASISNLKYRWQLSLELINRLENS
uniref:Glycosyl transferase family 1 domain-containing protein n=1 Tax=Paulinella longichromatophora TaxID=1708747 RepID=A0A2H4ZPK1_9EUKA|nr:hypothetical protein PLO_471 [Paulinella longichromatophora]